MVERRGLAVELRGVGGRRGGGCGSGVEREERIRRSGERLTRGERDEPRSVGAAEARVGTHINLQEPLLAGELAPEVQVNGEPPVGQTQVVAAQDRAHLGATRGSVVEPEP